MLAAAVCWVIDADTIMTVKTKRSLWSRLILVFGLFTGGIGIICAMTLDPAHETALLDQQASWVHFLSTCGNLGFVPDNHDITNDHMSDILFDLSNDNHAGLVLFSDADGTSAYYWSIMSGVVVFLCSSRLRPGTRTKTAMWLLAEETAAGPSVLFFWGGAKNKPTVPENLFRSYFILIALPAGTSPFVWDTRPAAM